MLLVLISGFDCSSTLIMVLRFGLLSQSLCWVMLANVLSLYIDFYNK